MTVDLERAQRAIDALRKPDASLQRVPNTIRQSIAEVIEDLVAGHQRSSEQAADAIKANTEAYAEFRKERRRREIAEARLAQAVEIVRWVDTWVTNPVTGYSVHALDGLFGMTRDKIGAFNASVSSPVTEKTDD